MCLLRATIQCLFCVAAFGQSPATFPDPDSLAAELHRLEKAASEGRGPQIIAALPSAWTVKLPGGNTPFRPRLFVDY